MPVIVTISHFATAIAVDRARCAKSLGAAMVMMMPPYHGALLKGTDEQTCEQFARVGEVGVPIMVQDAPLSGVDLPVPLLVRMAREIEQVRLLQDRMPAGRGQAARADRRGRRRPSRARSTARRRSP